MGLVKLGTFIEQSELRNTNGVYDETEVVGLSTSKQIISTNTEEQLAGSKTEPSDES